MSVVHDITAANLNARKHRRLHAGDHYDYEFILKEGGVITVLTGAKLWFTVKRSVGDDDAAALLQYDTDTATDMEITDDVGGVCVVKFKPADTEELEGTWVYDLQLLTSGSRVVTQATGKIQFLPNITRTIA